VPPAGGATPPASVAAVSAKERPEEMPASGPRANIASGSVASAGGPPATGPADQPVGKKAPAAETAWWDEAKPPATTGGESQPPSEPPGAKSE
jgi:hypothetical protein